MPAIRHDQHQHPPSTHSLPSAAFQIHSSSPPHASSSSLLNYSSDTFPVVSGKVDIGGVLSRHQPAISTFPTTSTPIYRRSPAASSVAETRLISCTSRTSIEDDHPRALAPWERLHKAPFSSHGFSLRENSSGQRSGTSGGCVGEVWKARTGPAGGIPVRRIHV